MNRKVTIILFVGLIIYGCSQSLYIPSSAIAEQQEQLLAGRKLYVDHCSGCHNLHFPKEFTTEQWISNLDEMQVKAKISDLEKQLILKYLTSQP
ncbi:MAG: hypothetical protein WBP41_16700 [Saprospiraceae bacterium]